MAPVVYLLGLSFLLSTMPTETTQRTCNGGRIHRSGKLCGDRLNRFLQDVLQAREDLTWIDQVAYQMHSKNILHENPDLQDKLNAMFFNSEQRVWTPPKNTNTIVRKRDRRHYKEPTENSQAKHNENPAPYHGANVLANNKKNSNSPKHEHNADSLLRQNYNSTMKSAQKIRTKNEMAATADPLEKILRSINVFPVEDDARDEFNDNAAENDFQSGLFKRVTVGAPPTGNQSFGKKHSRMRRSLKSSAESELDILDGNIIELPKSNDDADKTQTRKARGGDLAREIVDAIFNKLKDTGGFNVPISVSQHHSLPENSMLIENSNREKTNLAPTNENPSFLKKVMAMVQELTSEEAEKRSCAPLQPDLHKFLEWLIDSDIDNGESNNILRENTNNIIGNKLTNNNPIVNLGEWYQKAQSLKNLLNEYKELSKKEKSKVEAIYEYLVSRFEFVEAYIKAYESHVLPVDQLIKLQIK